MQKDAPLCRYEPEVEKLIPGLNEAYCQLRSPNHVGLYTSAGRLYNHTFFGRDAGMSAKFLNDYEPEIVKETIRALVRYQGCTTNPTTEEQPGRIHHELRDFARWNSRAYDRILYRIVGPLWGVKNHQLLTYFAHDTTATFIRLVHKYWFRTSDKILDEIVITKDGTEKPLRDCLLAAADWIVSCVDANGHFAPARTNRFSLPYQIFEDSVSAYSWSDKKRTNTNQKHTYVEAQSYAIDALQDMRHMFPEEIRSDAWGYTVEQLKKALFNDFWQKDNQFFASMLASRDGKMLAVTTPNISSSWTLNTLFWRDLSEPEREKYLKPIITRLFSDEFLTPVGLRTKSVHAEQPIRNVISYHGSETVWPMFTFMVIEGLRKHGFMRLALQLEYRIVNACRAIDGFQEFFVVDKDNTVYEVGKAGKKLSLQMTPEKSIAFTIAPLITIAHRVNAEVTLLDEAWRRELEDELLDKMEVVMLESRDEARRRINPQLSSAKRTVAGLKSAWYFLTQKAR